MKALITRVGTYVTGDALADALLNYSLVLARAQRVDLVELPFRAPSGAIARVQVRVGWMVDMDAVSHEQREPEVTEPGLIEDLRARGLDSSSHGDTPVTPDDVLGLDDEY